MFFGSLLRPLHRPIGQQLSRIAHGTGVWFEHLPSTTVVELLWVIRKPGDGDPKPTVLDIKFT